ncbi:hypothetical protein HK101_010358 [Irineochytrium annulatum]|nr:hypothetical protein HK101_010358 [Irineochytrium annulatum]
MGDPKWTNKMKEVFEQIYAEQGQSKRFNSEQLDLQEDVSTDFLDKVLNSASMSLLSMGARARPSVPSVRQ